MKQIKPPKQEKSRYHAHVTAHALRNAMLRIVGRDEGYPTIEQLTEEIIAKYGRKGANTEEVLKEMCSKYRLNSKSGNLKDALYAVNAKQLVVATFSLKEEQWHAFKAFFRGNPKGILSGDDLQKDGKTNKLSKAYSHAVILARYDEKSLVFMNTWGSKWGDEGYFRVQNPSILENTRACERAKVESFRVQNSSILNCKFYNVYWEINDLSDAEKKQFKDRGLNLAEGRRRCRPSSFYKFD